MIEMLVVVGIIAILVSMLVPSFKRSIEMASRTMCMHNLRSVGQALEMYQQDNDGWLPSDGASATVLASSSAPPGWLFKLIPTYLNDPVVFTCPEDPFRFRMLRSRGTVLSPEIADYPSYGLNSFIVTAAGGALADVQRQRPARPLNTILGADMGPDSVLGSGQSPKDRRSGPRRNHSFLTIDDGFNPFAPDASFTWLTTRHGPGINMLTLEGGVRNVRTVEVLNTPIRSYYSECLSGGCTLCLSTQGNMFVQHYSFARDSLFWWTGAFNVFTPSSE
ncbi:MAG: type II secretion system protein [Planctomycetes bacterium]|nr:type II secretion system protein [Planctomycetota bacterium]